MTSIEGRVKGAWKNLKCCLSLTFIDIPTIQFHFAGSFLEHTEVFVAVLFLPFDHWNFFHDQEIFSFQWTLLVVPQSAAHPNSPPLSHYLKYIEVGFLIRHIGGRVFTTKPGFSNTQRQQLRICAKTIASHAVYHIHQKVSNVGGGPKRGEHCENRKKVENIENIENTEYVCLACWYIRNIEKY